MSPCSLVFVATEKDMLYAFSSSSPSSNWVWKLDLANSVMVGNVHGTYLTCSPTGEPCATDTPGPTEGITGTPVIDMVTNVNTLFVVAKVQFPSPTYCQNMDSICFYLFAVDIRTGSMLSYQLIKGTVNGFSSHGNVGDCNSTLPHAGQITFEYHHPQRAALLLLPNSTVYVAFAAGKGDQFGETNNGWMFGYSFVNNAFPQQPVIFISTPYGTGGGIWQSGGGPAYDGDHIYVNTANGTLFDPTLRQTIPTDIGDSLLQLDPGTLTVTDFYSPSNALSYVGKKGTGLCINDEDFGSGGVLVPSDFTYTSSNGGNCSSGCSVAITADKQSNLYVVNRGNLGKFYSDPNCANDPNNIQCITTPLPKVDTSQGYWASPAYWHYQDSSHQEHYMLYYSATTEGAPGASPLPINGYSLLTGGMGGPIPSSPTASTRTLFCQRSPTPSGSWDGSHPNSGILWAIEHQNANNPGNCAGGMTFPTYAALHAFSPVPDQQGVLDELYSSRPPKLNTVIGQPTNFTTPTIFNGQVYVGTQGEVDVFGLCVTRQQGCLP